MMTLGFHSGAELLALRFIDSVVEGTLICLLAAAVLHVAPRQNAATRFAVWFSSLLAIAALPWFGAWSHTGGVAARSFLVLPESWSVWFVAIWAVIAAWFGIGVVRALWHLNVLRRNCMPMEMDQLDPLVRETLQHHGSRRGIALCTSEAVKVPTAVGLFKPAILLPGWVMRELSTADLNQILLHELAHFRRWDDWTNLVQQAVKALFFFHPAVWWLDQRVAVEREMACDDAVLAETRSPRAYAECLANLAEKSFVNRTVALAQAALGKIRQTSVRLARILDTNRPAPSARHRGVAVAVIAVLTVGCGVLYSRAPRLVAFGGSAATSQQLASVSDTSAPAFVGTDSRTENLKVPVIPARLHEPMLQARPKQKLKAPRVPNHDRVATLRAKTNEAESNLIHLTASGSVTVPAMTETFWLVVEREGTDAAAPQVYQIQMWRVTVLRTVFTAPSRQVPRNET